MAHNFNRILFTTDLSQRSKEVFDYTVSLAVKTKATILILHVIEDESSRTKDIVVDMIGDEAYEKIQKENESYARNILLGKQKQVPIIKDTLEKLGQHAAVAEGIEKQQDLVEGVVIRMGQVVDEILEVSNEGKCDMIVMGHHQRSMLTKAIIGRTVRGVMRRSKVPIFLVPLDT
jgi:nucleotide-binding universal stress UspA family protein